METNCQLCQIQKSGQTFVCFVLWQILIFGFMKCSIRERVFKDCSNPQEVLSEKELFEKLRFPRHVIQQLAFDLEEQLRRQTSRNCSIPPLLQICLALHFFATRCCINAAADIIGVHKSTASRIIHSFLCQADFCCIRLMSLP